MQHSYLELREEKGHSPSGNEETKTTPVIQADTLVGKYAS